MVMIHQVLKIKEVHRWTLKSKTMDKSLNDLLKSGQNASSGDDLPPSETKAPTGFAPLDPPKLVRTKDPEELAQAVRHLTDK